MLLLYCVLAALLPGQVVSIPAPGFGNMLFNALGITKRDPLPAAAASSTSTATATSAGVGMIGYKSLAAASSAFSQAGIPSVLPEGTAPALYTTAALAASVMATFITSATQPLGGPSASQYSGVAFLLDSLLFNLIPGLLQSITNGKSIWGTLSAPLLSPFISGPLVNGWPWGSRTSNNTNYYNLPSIPNTGVTRTYSFAISEQTIAPDGVPMPGLVINGGFPGPLIEANWGDMISVTVTNNLPDAGTSLHWHGFLQKNTPYYDGVPSVQQCPIAPGKSFTYTFQAELYGTTWYHSHYTAQYSSGLSGPLVVHGPSNIAYDIDLGPIMLSDWYHSGYKYLVEMTMVKANAVTPHATSNNNLINGKMNYPCSSLTPSCTPNAGLSKFKFTSGKKHRLRLINSGAEGIQKFAIDGHNFTVMANDFVEIEPYVTDVITLGVGQRTDVIVEGLGSPTSSWWMRSNISVPCSLNDGISPDAVAVVYYQDANLDTVPTSVSTVDPSHYSYCGNDPLSEMVPFMPLTPDPNPPVTQELNLVLTTNSTGYTVWDVNNSSFRGDYNDPILLEAKLGNYDFDLERNVYNFYKNSSIRLVVYNYFQLSAHPMHLHGHNMYVLAEGTGTWDGHITNAANPQRRDVQLVKPALSDSTPSYIVVQIDADNPGVWPFHCHIAWHVSGGLYVNILERPADIAESNIPMVLAQTCRDWWAWTGANVVDQIDSGL